MKPSHSFSLQKLSFIFFVVFFIISCNNTVKNNELINEIPTDECCKSATDTISYTGVVLDGAMNSVFIVTDKNDTLSFGYVMLNRDKIQSYRLDDTITVNTQADTVIGIINNSKH